MATKYDYYSQDSVDTAVLGKPYLLKPELRSTQHWPRPLSTLTQRIQLQLRHRLGITVSFPSLPWDSARRRNHSASSSSFTTYTPPKRLSVFLRRGLYATLLTPLFILVLVILYGGVPPSYSDVKRKEWALPQHHWVSTISRMMGGTRGARSMRGVEEEDSEAHEIYLRFPDHVWGHGLNNVLQEAILSAHLTLTTSSRTPVFEPYTWSHLSLPYTLYDFALRPTRVPLSAFVGGILTGATAVNESTSNGDGAARHAVSADYFKHVCPQSEIVEVVYGHDGRSEDGETLPAPSYSADGREILVWFESRLRAPDVSGKRCVVIREDGDKVPGARRVFDTDFFGAGDRILRILPELLESPVLKHFEWSPIVQRAVDRSIGAVFAASGTEESYPLSEGISSPTPLSPPAQLEGVLAVHLRRGDYGRHCVRLAQWSSQYLGVNRALGDKFGFVDVEEHDDGDSEDERDAMKAKRREAYYLEHCLPSVPQIVRRLNEVRAEYELGRSDSLSDSTLTPRLRNVYVLTNGWPSFVDELRKALMEDGWEGVVATQDLERGIRGAGERWPAWYYGSSSSSDSRVGKSGFAGLTREERGVGVAVDMGIAERAEVFVGNGFSSLSANIVMLRMARGFGRDVNRLL
ncbi:hypothetical protein BDN70DRAFT_841049 [Pholiota conissans]|uniref:O-fucosyltransferase family protein n=1 Tax=Pholiota conissans TaxID=109636 RepID=A0A9P5YUH6_9AGAR|nr:hypothetical protein BDN70DRAFT_841049 [Pholiota conissans]